MDPNSRSDPQASEPQASDPRYIWDLTDLYPSDEMWDGARNRVADRLPELEAMKGKLTRSATSLQQGLDLLFGLTKEAQRVRHINEMGQRMEPPFGFGSRSFHYLQ